MLKINPIVHTLRTNKSIVHSNLVHQTSNEKTVLENENVFQHLIALNTPENFSLKFETFCADLVSLRFCLHSFKYVSMINHGTEESVNKTVHAVSYRFVRYNNCTIKKYFLIYQKHLRKYKNQNIRDLQCCEVKISQLLFLKLLDLYISEF